MSFYQHCYMGDTSPSDTKPDYLTCGYCAREFLLANITMFIAHKVGGCDSTVDKDLKEATQDMSSPLTCSYCSRVFFTARGLLQHVEVDHNMYIGIKKGPLIIPDILIDPPPAHVVGKSFGDFSTRPAVVENEERHHDDQPTDLSMSCRNKLGKAVIDCSGDSCKITLKPNFCTAIEDPQKDRSVSNLPKKRRFADERTDFVKTPNSFQPSHDMFVDPDSIIDFYSCRGEGRGVQGDVNSSVRSEADESQSDSPVNVLITAQYEEEKLCCVSLSTEKSKEGENSENSDEASTVLNSNCTEEMCEGSGGSCPQTDKTTRVVYKLPKQVCDSHEFAKPFLVHVSSGAGTHCPISPKKVSTPTTISSRLLTSSTSAPVCSLSSCGVDSLVTHVSPVMSQKRLYSSTVHSRPMNQGGAITSESVHGESVAPLPLWNDHLEFERDGTSNLFIPSSYSDDVNADEFQILKMNPSPSSSTNASSMVPGPVPSHYFPSALESPKLLSPQSNLSTVPSTFDFDVFAAQGANSTKSANVVEREFQAFIVRDGSDLSNSYTTPMGKDSSVGKHSDRTLTTSSHDDSLQIVHLLLENKSFVDNAGDSSLGLESADKNAKMFFISPETDSKSTITTRNENKRESNQELKRSPSEIVQRDNTGGQENVKSDSQRTQSTSEDGFLLKKRRYPTSKPFQCNHCDQAFNQRIHLKKHMSKHTGVKPFKCPHCDYSTVERSHLKVHFRVHTGEKPFRCKHCDYATAQNSTLKIHLKRHHEELQKLDGQRADRHASNNRSVNVSNREKNIPVNYHEAVDDNDIVRTHLIETSRPGPSVMNSLSERGIGSLPLELIDQNPPKLSDINDTLATQRSANLYRPPRKGYKRGLPLQDTAASSMKPTSSLKPTSSMTSTSSLKPTSLLKPKLSLSSQSVFESLHSGPNVDTMSKENVFFPQITPGLSDCMDGSSLSVSTRDLRPNEAQYNQAVTSAIAVDSRKWISPGTSSLTNVSTDRENTDGFCSNSELTSSEANTDALTAEAFSKRKNDLLQEDTKDPELWSSISALVADDIGNDLPQVEIKQQAFVRG